MSWTSHYSKVIMKIVNELYDEHELLQDTIEENRYADMANDMDNISDAIDLLEQAADILN